jgi:hypothetical protein
MFEGVLEPREKLDPSGLSTGQHRLGGEVCKRAMVRDYGQFSTSLKVASPFPESLDDAQHLLLTCGIVDFCWAKFRREVGHRLTILNQDGSTASHRSV